MVGLLAFTAGRWSGDGVSGRAGDVPSSVQGTPLVLDGDTLDFNGMRVRLFGIDAFEREQLCRHEDGSRFACGQLARESLVTAIAQSPVRCERRDVDRYGRMVGVCFGAEGDLAARVVEDGFALAYRRYSRDYVDEEDAAHRAGRGAWGGRFDAPWDYRHDGRGGTS